jgi:hypothetical protein
MGLTVDSDLSGSGRPWAPPLVGSEFARIGACGRSFGRGVFRFHDAESGPIAKGFISAAFPDLMAHVDPLAFDWLGRQFVVSDETSSEVGEPEVMLLNVASMTREGMVAPGEFMQALQTPLMLEVLHTDLFDQWRSETGSAGLDFDRCAGLKVPAFLSGTTTLDNLEESDIEVYWSLCSQLWKKVKGLPEGSRVQRVGIDNQ